MIKPFFRKFIKPIQEQKGATLLIAALILALLTVFVSTALINSSSSGISINNDAKTKNSFYVSYAALEMMSKEFSDIFTANLSPTTTQLNTIKANAEKLANSSDPSVRIVNGMNLKTDIRKGDFTSSDITLANGPYSGLKALREEYVFTATSTTNSGVSVQLTRSLYNNLIPIFQFGIFSTRHLEFYNGPPFNFGGRVHSNKDIYLSSTGTTKFTDRVTTVGQITFGMQRNGYTRTAGDGFAVGDIKINSSSGSSIDLTMGSVNGGPNIVPDDPRPGHPTGTSNKTAFDNFIKTNLSGQVFVKAPVLKLPIQNTNNRPIEIIRRGLPGEDPATEILAQSRFYNKAGLRITLSDLQTQLPGGTGGIQLDKAESDTRLGYKPASLGSYQASRINGHRIKGWIKVETVKRQNDGSLLTTDITAPILALGVTRYDNGTADRTALNAVSTTLVPIDATKFSGFDPLTAYNNLDDSKSIIRLQRLSAPATAAITRSDGGAANSLTGTANNLIVGPNTGTANVTPEVTNSTVAPFVFPLVDNVPDQPQNSDTPPIIYNGGTIKATTSPVAPAKTKLLASGMMVAYPINLYDQREGGALDTSAGNNVHLNGVMSLVDIDMGNLKKLLTGGFDTDFSNGSFSFVGRSIPSETNGWIIYVSDRRGDSYDPTSVTLANRQKDHYGKYDFETNYGNTTSGSPRKPYTPTTGQTLFEIEDTNDNGIIEFPSPTNVEGALPDEFLDRIDALTKGPWHPNTSTNNTTSISTSTNLFNSGGTGNASLTRIRLDNSGDATQTALFRRAVRLSNGNNLTNPAQTTNDKPLNLNRGITITSENPVYVLGNYNTTGIITSPTTTPANFQGNEVPAAIISDSITLLSNNWKDSIGFTVPYAINSRLATDTQYRFGAFTGRTRDGLFLGNNDTTKWGTKGSSGNISPEPNDVRLYGGVHNFLRYIESWDDPDAGGPQIQRKLSYCGSIIDGWDSFQTNGTYKCCDTVYEPPIRDYIFNTAFQNVDRLPPGTPNLQYILFTNFRENVNPKQF